MKEQEKPSECGQKYGSCDDQQTAAPVWPARAKGGDQACNKEPSRGYGESDR